jgi:hypothetical protein
MTTKELTTLINTAFEAVDKSVVGPVWRSKDLDQINSLAMNTFFNVLANVVPKVTESVVSGTMQVKEPKEPWQQDEE